MALKKNKGFFLVYKSSIKRDSCQWFSLLWHFMWLSGQCMICLVESLPVHRLVCHGLISLEFRSWICSPELTVTSSFSNIHIPSLHTPFLCQIHHIFSPVCWTVLNHMYSIDVFILALIAAAEIPSGSGPFSSRWFHSIYIMFSVQ